MKTLSLIIPIYNEEKTLVDIVEKTLSIKNHHFMIENNINLELVLIDDCSSDESLKIACNLSKQYNEIKVFSHQSSQLAPAPGALTIISGVLPL